MATTVSISCNRPHAHIETTTTPTCRQTHQLVKTTFIFAATSSRQGVKQVKGVLLIPKHGVLTMIRSKCFQHYIIFPCEPVNVWINYCDKDHLFFFSKKSYDFAFGFAITPSNNGITKSNIVYMTRLNSQPCWISGGARKLRLGMPNS